MRIFQFDVMKRYLDTGGSILVLTGEGGEARFDTNVNFFLEEFGISVNAGGYAACPVDVNLFILFNPFPYQYIYNDCSDNFISVRLIICLSIT